LGFKLGLQISLWHYLMSTLCMIVWLMLVRYLVVGTPKVPFFFFCDWHQWLAHHKNPKIVANGTCPKHVCCSVLVLILLFRSQDQNWRQRIWDKARCYWEHIGNPVGTWWEHIGKIVAPPFSQGKNKLGPWVHAGSPPCYPEFLCLPPLFLPIFGVG
jgi:hypothetical protein